MLLQAFPSARQAGPNQLIFTEIDSNVYNIMRFVADRQIPLLKLERAEPTLESLFMEVAGQ